MLLIRCFIGLVTLLLAFWLTLRGQHRPRSPGLVAIAALVLGLSLAACGTDRPRSAGDELPQAYAVPVSSPCIAAEGRPAKVKPLNQRYPREQWATMPIGAKAQAVAAQGGERMNYEDRSEAATSACR